MSNDHRTLSDEQLSELSDLTLQVRHDLLQLTSLDALTACCILRIQEQAVRDHSARRLGQWLCEWSILQALYRSLQEGFALLPTPDAETHRARLFVLRRTIGLQ